MAENLLPTSNGSGTQTTSQNPQATGQLQSAGQQTDLLHISNVQTSVPSAQLDNLGAQTLTVANSKPSPAATAHVSVAKPQLQHHHINPMLMSLVLGLLVAAVILFWWIMKSAKTTTKYS